MDGHVYRWYFGMAHGLVGLVHVSHLFFNYQNLFLDLELLVLNYNPVHAGWACH